MLNHSKLSVIFRFLYWLILILTIKIQVTNGSLLLESKGGYRPENHTIVKHLVSLRTKNFKYIFGDNHFCGGTILSPKIIITAAHCLVDSKNNIYDPKGLLVVAGTPFLFKKTSGTQILNIERVIVHDNYKISYFAYDIGLLRLRGKLVEDNIHVESIPLSRFTPQHGNICTCVGWGKLYFLGPISAEALYFDNYVWNFLTCIKRMPMMTRHMICATALDLLGKDACSGDSGGPLICKDKLAGIVSFGIGCGFPGYPSIYTDVAYFREWIIENCTESQFKFNVFRHAILQILNLIIIFLL